MKVRPDTSLLKTMVYNMNSSPQIFKAVNPGGQGVESERMTLPERPLITYFPQRFQLGLHDELVLAEFTAACIRTLDPLLQASLVHKMEASCTVAGGDQRVLIIAFTVADPMVETD